MAAQLNASPAFLKLGFLVTSSSHGSLFDRDAAYNQSHNDKVKASYRLQTCFPKGTKIKAWGGLTIADEFGRAPGDLCKLPEKSYAKQRQVDSLARVLATSQCKVSLLIAGSNDFKFFAVNNGRLVQVSEKGMKTWGNMDQKQKRQFTPKQRIKEAGVI